VSSCQRPQANSGSDSPATNALNNVTVLFVTFSARAKLTGVASVLQGTRPGVMQVDCTGVDVLTLTEEIDAFDSYGHC